MIEATDIGLCSPAVTLSEFVDRYMAIRGIHKKKYYSKYLIIAGEIWKEVFQKTLWTTQSVWRELKDGDPYPYIDVPKNTNRIFSVAVTDKCNKIQPLYYNSQLNIIPKPITRNCSCAECECDLCEEINGTVVTTKELFTINGTTYYEKCWIKYCKNGDILEHCEIPTKKYNTFSGDGGAYADDYNNDYDIGSNPLADFTIETVIQQKKICQLATKPCGCPQPTPENEEIVQQFCGCLLPLFSRRKKKHCRQFLDNVNNNHFGEVKISECGTKIYYKPSKCWQEVSNSQYPDFLLINFQTTGMIPGQEVLIPQYAESVMRAGVDWLSKQYNNMYSLGEKRDAKYHYVDEQNSVIMYLNPISLSMVNTIQDQKIQW